MGSSLWLWACVAVAAVPSFTLWHFRSHLRPGYATTGLAFLAVFYAVALALATSPMPRSVGIAFIIVAFALMAVEINSISRDANERDGRYKKDIAERDSHHAELLEHFSRVFSLLLDSVRYSREASGFKKDGLEQRLVDVGSDLLGFAGQRQIEDPAYATPTLDLTLDPMEMMRRSNAKLQAATDYARKTGEIYNVTFPQKIAPLIDEAEKLGKSYDGPYYRGYQDIYQLSYIADALHRLAVSLDGE